MTSTVPQWNGTDKELKELVAALDTWCDDEKHQTCGHKLVLTQEGLDHLLFARRTAAFWREKENE